MPYLKQIWQVADPDPTAVKELLTLGIPPLLAKVLANRGITSGIEAKNFLSAGLEQIISPFVIPGMDQAVARIIKAVTDREKILIYGDYDVDGITSTVLLIELLRELQADVDYYIPDRMEEGYGLNKAALQSARESGFRLVITVDCGISAVEEIDFATDLGLDIVITDHHQPGIVLPRACAVVDPKLNPDGVLTELAGVGVAFKLGQALVSALSVRIDVTKYLDLVALGSIADIVPLTGENRILVKHGLQLINDQPRPGIRALIKSAGLSSKKITAGHIAFMVAPRINAAGRIGTAGPGVELLMTDSARRAEELACFFELQNRERQALETEILRQAEEQINRTVDLTKEKVIVLADAGWHPGVIGIVASRIVDKYYRPTVLISLESSPGKGSARSIKGFNIYQALDNCSSLLERYGGHEAAAGLAILPEKIPELRFTLNRLADTFLTEKDFLPILKIESEVTAADITEETLAYLEKIEPFGVGNPAPVFLYRSAILHGFQKIANGKHLRLTIGEPDQFFQGIAFGYGEAAGSLKPQQFLDLAFTLEQRESLQLILKAFKPHEVPDCPFVHDEVAAAIEDGAFPCHRADQLLGSLSPSIQNVVNLLLKERRVVVTTTAEEFNRLWTITASLFQAKGLKTLVIYPHRAALDIDCPEVGKKCLEFGLRFKPVYAGLKPEQVKAAYEGLESGQLDVLAVTFPVLRNISPGASISWGLIVLPGCWEITRAGSDGAGLQDVLKWLGELTCGWKQKVPLLAARPRGTNQDFRLRDTFFDNEVITDALPGQGRLVDCRKEIDKLSYLSNLIVNGTKTIVWVNRKRLAVQLASALKSKLVPFRREIYYYHGSLDYLEARRNWRQFLERGRVLVATPALLRHNLADKLNLISDIVFYSMPFNNWELTRQAFIDGSYQFKGYIHLLFNEDDQEYNHVLLNCFYPERQTLAVIYNLIKEFKAKEFFTLTDLTTKIKDKGLFMPQLTIKSALGIFRELELVAEQEEKYYLLQPVEKARDLVDSSLYLEGLALKNDFLAFRKIIFED